MIHEEPEFLTAVLVSAEFYDLVGAGVVSYGEVSASLGC